MMFKFRHRFNGGHVHIRVFAGTNPDALGKCGDLTMRPDEWEAFVGRVNALPFTSDGSRFVFIDDSAEAPAYALPLDGPEFS